MSAPWRGWYHCTITTYGAWLQGDERGFRERHHRRHVDGDYRDPPPKGAHATFAERSHRDVASDAVVFSAAQQQTARDAFVKALRRDNVKVARLCVAPTHVHILCRFPDRRKAAIPGLAAGNMLTDGRDPVPRHMLGRAKQHASRVLRCEGLRPEAPKLWGTRTKAVPIEDRCHQVAAARYIERHPGVHWSCA